MKISSATKTAFVEDVKHATTQHLPLEEVAGNFDGGVSTLCAPHTPQRGKQTC